MARHDDRTEAWASLLPAGSYESTYLARAVLPGEFRAAPVWVEEYDAPEVYGRGAGERVVIEER
jgi:alpha-2-macroglobulin